LLVDLLAGFVLDFERFAAGDVGGCNADYRAKWRCRCGARYWALQITDEADCQGKSGAA
jgi:hypothetical protein